MPEIIRFDAYTLIKRADKTYEAVVHPDKPTPRVVIPEEYDGIPITKIIMDDYILKSALTVCVSKNVRVFMNSINILARSQPYFVETDPENPWLFFDDKAVFSKDKTVLYAFAARGDESYTIPDGVKAVCDYAFYGANRLYRLNFPNSLEEIGDRAFMFCRVSELRLPNSVRKIGSQSLAVTHALRFVLPDNVKEIAPDAFERASSIKPVFIPDCYGYLNAGIPNASFAPEYFIDENSKMFTIIDGVVYTKDMKTLLAVTRKAPKVLSVPDGVEIIGSKAFIFDWDICEVILPKSVHTISNAAFYRAHLKKINLENVKTIEDNAFENCRFLRETGNIGARKIGRHCFSRCDFLGYVNLTDIKEIGAGAFRRLKDNAVMILPEGLEKVYGDDTFNSSFRSFRVPRSASELENVIPKYADEVELYDVENSVIYKKDPKINDFRGGCLVKVLSPENDEIKYVVKLFAAEKSAAVDPQRYINSLFGGEQFFDLEKYDKFLKASFNGFDPNGKYAAAHYRIKYPVKLTDDMRAAFMEYLESNAFGIFLFLLGDKSPVERIAEFPYLCALNEKELLTSIECAVGWKLTEITAFLINYKNERFPNSDGTETVH